MEGHETRCVAEAGQECRDIAITKKDFRMGNDFLRIKFGYKVIGAIATAGAEKGADVVAGKHFFQLACSAFTRSGEVQVLIEDGVKINRSIAKFLQGGAADIEGSALDVAGRRNDGHRIAWLQSSGLNSRFLGNHVHGKLDLNRVVSGPVSDEGPSPNGEQTQGPSTPLRSARDDRYGAL